MAYPGHLQVSLADELQDSVAYAYARGKACPQQHLPPRRQPQPPDMALKHLAPDPHGVPFSSLASQRDSFGMPLGTLGIPSINRTAEDPSDMWQPCLNCYQFVHLWQNFCMYCGHANVVVSSSSSNAAAKQNPSNMAAFQPNRPRRGQIGEGKRGKAKADEMHTQPSSKSSSPQLAPMKIIPREGSEGSMASRWIRQTTAGTATSMDSAAASGMFSGVDEFDPGDEEEDMDMLSDDDVAIDDPLLGPAPYGPPTTLMIRNIPVMYTQEALVLEWPNNGTYDFFYLPYSCSLQRNLTYAFINFTSHEYACAFKIRWEKMRLAHFTSRKPLNISCADVQGRDENLWQLKKKRIWRLKVKQCQPLIYENGVRVSLGDAFRKLKTKMGVWSI